MAQLPTEEVVDVVICGSGSAGLACALWLAIYNDRYCKPDPKGKGRTPITYRILESRDGPLQVGQADGVQCRTVEIYESFGLDHIIKNEGYWVNEVSFWATDNDASESDKAVNGDTKSRKPLVRTGRAADVRPGLSHQPHLILNQARINGLMLERIKELKGHDVDYSWQVIGVESDESTNQAYPVKVTAEKLGEQKIVRAKYALGADGAHSQVRHALQIPMEGDSTNAVWGVMDVYPKTTFPDVRKKSTLRSEVGTLLIIPREGDDMIRNYIELPHGTNPKAVRLEDLQAAAKGIFYPYDIEFLATKWWSAYSIGQRVARDMADKSGRVFLAGDACHTHSPKAGQGMNASLQDGYNLGWKLGAFLTGQADKKLLSTYVQERHAYAQQLIDFDRYWAKMFSSGSGQDGKKAAPEEFNQAFVKGGVFTAGMAANYQGSLLVDKVISNQDLAKKVIVGERLPSAQVVRMSDSKPSPLLKLLQSDGRWRIMIFPGDIEKADTLARLNQVGQDLISQTGAITTYTPAGVESDVTIETLVVLHGDRKKVEFEQIHSAFKPNFHDLPIMNLHKIYFDDESWNWGHGKAYKNLEISTHKGCIIVARPDQYVSAVIGLEDAPLLTDFFGKFMRRVNRN